MNQLTKEIRKSSIVDLKTLDFLVRFEYTYSDVVLHTGLLKEIPGVEVNDGKP